MPDLELRKIQPNRLNPRLEFSKAGLDELADSIKQVGLLEPIIVRPKSDSTFEVVVGERRYRAAQQAGLDKVPVIIREYTDEQVLELNFIENAQRVDLSAVEKAKLCQELLKRFPHKYPSAHALSKALGVSEQAVSEWLKSLEMPEEVQRMIKPESVTFQRKGEGKIDYRTAVVIARQIKEPERQVELARKLANVHVPTHAMPGIIRQVAKETEKPIDQVFREAIDEVPIFLPFSKVHADAILREAKTQTSRRAKDARLQKGVTVRAQVTHFADLEVTDVYRKRLGNFDEEDARREGGYTLDEFKEVWKKLHGEWNPNESVYIIKFRLARVVGESSILG